MFLPKSIEYCNVECDGSYIQNLFCESEVPFLYKQVLEYNSETSDIVVSKSKIRMSCKNIHLNCNLDNVFESDEFVAYFDDNNSFLIKYYVDKINDGDSFILPNKFTIKDEVKTIDTICKYAIHDNNGKNGKYLYKLIIPNTYKYIREEAITLSEIEELIFEQNSNLILIDDRAFSFKIKMKELIIPKSVEVLGYSVFKSGEFGSFRFESESKL